MRRVRIRTLIVAIAFLALLLALFVQSWRASAREDRLRAELTAARTREQLYRARVEAFLSDSSIVVKSRAASPRSSTKSAAPPASPPP